MSLKPSTIKNAGRGIFTEIDLPAGLFFGPYEVSWKRVGKAILYAFGKILTRILFVSEHCRQRGKTRLEKTRQSGKNYQHYQTSIWGGGGGREPSHLRPYPMQVPPPPPQSSFCPTTPRFGGGGGSAPYLSHFWSILGGSEVVLGGLVQKNFRAFVATPPPPPLRKPRLDVCTIDTGEKRV